MIKLDQHIVEIDGVKYVPLNIVNEFVAETYVDKVNEINNVLNKALSTYDKGIKDILNND